MNFCAIYDEAHKAGLAAVEALSVRPMIVQDGSQEYFVADGVCGFAWLSFKGNTQFAKWAKAQPDISVSKGYPTGLTIWVSEFNQSMQRKEAYAQAVANTLRQNGIVVYARSRMD